MKQSAKFVVVALAASGVAMVAASAGYWAGNRTAVERGAPAQQAGTAAKTERKPLYYRNPMGLPDTSPVPKKDPMGMDYIAVYADEQDGEPASVNQLRISTDKVQKLGVRTEAAELRTLDRIVRAAGRIEPDERRLYAITSKFEGYVERLHVNATGQPVAKGQPLFEVYSPELVSAQREYAIAVQGIESLKDAGGEARRGMQQLADASLARLKNWDISEEQVKALVASGEARRTLTFRSPVTGIVTERKALQGMRFMPGETLYQIADLSAVWVVADIFEQDIGLVKSGARVKVRINAYPDKLFEGTVTYVYPTLKAETRTVPVRAELANPRALLKPGMFAQVEMQVGARTSVVTVPVSAVIDSGTRQIVLVQAKEGRYEPRDVKLGARSDNYVEVREGLRRGETVVVAANFLIDAESNMKAAIGGFGGGAQGGGQPAAAGTPAVAARAGHRADGTLDGVDAQSGTLSISHGPVASLKWPAMTMEFKVANDALLRNLAPGMPIAFEFVERQPGEWVVTRITRAGKTGAGAAATDPHAGH